MTPAEVIDALHAAGATLVVEDGKARVRGAKVPADLLAVVKANRDAVIAEWKRQQEGHRDRYGEVPTGDVLMPGKDTTLTQEQSDLLRGYVFRQPRPVHAWVMARTATYFAQGLPPGEDEDAACLDVLAWQRHTTARLALEWLLGIEEAAKCKQQQN